MANEYILDGTKMVSLEAFFDEIGRTLIPDAEWGRNLDAFDDVLRGGFGTPRGGYTIRWKNSAKASELLGHAETARQLSLRLQTCHPLNREEVSAELASAQEGRGPTVFDWLVDIIRTHGPGGQEAEDDVRLILD